MGACARAVGASMQPSDIQEGVLNRWGCRGEAEPRPWQRAGKQDADGGRHQDRGGIRRTEDEVPIKGPFPRTITTWVGQAATSVWDWET